MSALQVISSPEPKAHGVRVVWYSSRRPSVRACVRACAATFSKIFSETAKPIKVKCYMKHL